MNLQNGKRLINLENKLMVLVGKEQLRIMDNQEKPIV